MILSRGVLSRGNAPALAASRLESARFELNVTVSPVPDCNAVKNRQCHFATYQPLRLSAV